MYMNSALLPGIFMEIQQNLDLHTVSQIYWSILFCSTSMELKLDAELELWLPAQIRLPTSCQLLNWNTDEILQHNYVIVPFIRQVLQ